MTARPPVRAARPQTTRPSPAERARTVATCAAAAVHAPGIGCAPLPAAAVTAAGEVLLVVPRRGGLAAAVRRSLPGDLPARLTVTRPAAAALRDPVRGRLELRGGLAPVPPHEEPDLLASFAEARPADVLLDVGLTADLLRLDAAGVVLEEGGRRIPVAPEDFAAAQPDPLAAVEADLVSGHAGLLAELTARVRRWAGEDDGVHLLGLDRCGVLFRVEGPTGHYDLRVPFAAAVADPAGVRPALDAVLACGPD